MFTIELSNGTKLEFTVDLTSRVLRIHQVATRNVPSPQMGSGELVIPLTDLKSTAERVTALVKAFRG